jgi:hypothetical protein
MSEPPPSPLETTELIPSNAQMLYIPYNPSLGFQKFLFIQYGLRGDEPGGYALPRSSRQTFRPDQLRNLFTRNVPCVLAQAQWESLDLAICSFLSTVEYDINLERYICMYFPCNILYFYPFWMAGTVLRTRSDAK